jgi:lysophospholipase L1-like esterase
MKKTLLFLLLFIFGLSAGFFYGKRIYFSLSSKSNALNIADSVNKLALQTYNDLPIDTSDVVFVGTSITARFPMNEMFGTMHIKNRGISSNCSYHIIGRIGNILNAHPKKIFLEFGINDFCLGIGVDSLFHAYKKVISMSHNLSPGTQIYVQSVFPVSRWGKDHKAEPLIEKFNPILKKYCDSIHTPFIDIFPSLYKQDGLDTSLSVDGTHLNMKGYAVWKNEVAPFIQ